MIFDIMESVLYPNLNLEFEKIFSKRILLENSILQFSLTLFFEVLICSGKHSDSFRNIYEEFLDVSRNWPGNFSAEISIAKEAARSRSFESVLVLILVLALVLVIVLVWVWSLKGQTYPIRGVRGMPQTVTAP